MLNYRDKIMTLEEALPKLEEVKSQGKKVVFTNGCFDILHMGHIHYLEKSRQLGNYLIVGLNSDASVRALKGEGRPVKELASRSAVLAGLASVDMVITFEEDTPLLLIQKVVPDILVKGGDYKKEDIVGGEYVMQNGGSVEVIEFLEGHSSSALIEKMEKK